MDYIHGKSGRAAHQKVQLLPQQLILNAGVFLALPVDCSILFKLLYASLNQFVSLFNRLQFFYLLRSPMSLEMSQCLFLVSLRVDLYTDVTTKLTIESPPEGVWMSVEYASHSTRSECFRLMHYRLEYEA